MKMTPHQILTHLGFEIPEEGIDVSEHDAYLHSESLRLLGSTISVDRIDDYELLVLHRGMAGIVAAHRGEVPKQANSDTGKRLKVLIHANCNVTYKLNLRSEKSRELD